MRAGSLRFGSLEFIGMEGIGPDGLKSDDRLVFDPRDNPLYKVDVAWSEEHQEFYVAGREAIVTRYNVTQLSGDDLISNQSSLGDITDASTATLG